MSIAQEIQRLQSAKADIKSAIEQKGVTVGDGTIDTYAEKISEISGGSSGVDLGKLCTEIKFESLNIFDKSEVVLDLDNATSLRDIFAIPSNIHSAQNTTVEHITINCKKTITDMYRAFYCYYNNDNTLKQITLNVDTGNLEAFNNVFVGCKALETIDGTPFNFSNSKTFTQTFRLCSALKDFRVLANSIYYSISVSECTYLSTDTIQSIIDGLADLTGGTAQTLTFHKDVKLLQSQVDSANAKGWTIAGGTVVSEEEYYG